jgi:rhomboid-like protein
MVLSGAAASRILRSGSRILQKCLAVDHCNIGLLYTPIRPYSISSYPFRQKPIGPFNALEAYRTTSPWQWAACVQFRTANTHASTRIIRRFEDLPHNYKDEDGLPFRAKPLSKNEAVAIFGAGTDAGTANRTLRIFHGRRVAGTLADPSLPCGYEERVKTIALSWLRKNIPMDETDSAGKRAEIELQAMEADVLADGERLGLYKPNSGGAATQGNGKNSIYGESGLDAIRAAKKEQYAREEKAKAQAKKSQADEIRENTGPLETAVSRLASRVELMKAGEHPRLKYYLERAKVLPDVPPEMSAWQRLWPSGLVTLLVIGFSICWAQVYIPPITANRMWPDFPPAAATISALILMNCVIFVLWHHPPAFRMLNKYFIVVPGYPRGLAILGNIFSHQTLRHLVLNMIVLWFMGTRLHDDIGRANFLAIYLSSGVFASFASLAIFTFRRHFMTSSLGASGAICGLVGAFLWIHGADQFKILGLPPNPLPGVSGLGFLVPAILIELLGLRKLGKSGAPYDHYAHLGGYLAGIVGGEICIRQAAKKRRIGLEAKRIIPGVEIKPTGQRP